MKGEQSEPSALGVIEVSGADSAWFLGAQLTNDVDRLGTDNHFLAAWCDARGRAVAVCRVVRTERGFWLITARSLIASLIERLRLYVLRARVEVVDGRDTHRVVGLLNADDPAPGLTRRENGITYLGLGGAPGHEHAALAVCPAATHPPNSASPTAGEHWQLARIDAGVPQLTAATQGLFVPQMLNLHWLHGVDFDKGCYPGQEVVARLQYRGRLTRHLFRCAWRGERPVPGATVYSADGATQGSVLQAAAADAQGGRLLAVLKVDAVNAALHCDDATITPVSLPYPTPALGPAQAG